MTTNYRWSSDEAAAAYDAAAPAIHPRYEAVQSVVVEAVAQRVAELAQRNPTEPFVLLDLGGGSGRLLERHLERCPEVRALLVDQSGPFLALAERRLARFAERVQLVAARLQDDWPALIAEPCNAIISTSAIHHLDASEKRELWRRSHGALAPGGILVNGDEYRPADDAQYRAELEWWSAHMEQALASARIPPAFEPMIKAWQRRNLSDFGGARSSGDDCHETVAEQQAALLDEGFVAPRVLWQDRLWSVIAAHKQS